MAKNPDRQLILQHIRRRYLGIIFGFGEQQYIILDFEDNNEFGWFMVKVKLTTDQPSQQWGNIRYEIEKYYGVYPVF
jgi:hypothetical protein